MNKKFKPKPTEYKGTVFRSKSEAIFARHLELCGFDWRYEPKPSESFWIGGVHTWDFLALKFVEGVEHRYFIEYKPSKPTKTYVDNLRKDVSSDPKYALMSELYSREHRLVRIQTREGVKEAIEKSYWANEPASDHDFMVLEKLNSAESNHDFPTSISFVPAILVSHNYFEDSDFEFIEIAGSQLEHFQPFEYEHFIEHYAEKAKSFRFDLEG